MEAFRLSKYNHWLDFSPKKHFPRTVVCSSKPRPSMLGITPAADERCQMEQVGYMRCLSGKQSSTTIVGGKLICCDRVLVTKSSPRLVLHGHASIVICARSRLN